MIDFSLDKNKVTINSEIELIKQQIDLLFDTDKMEVLGDNTFGTHYEEFLYDMKMSAESIEYTIARDLGKLVLFGYTPYVKVDMYQGTENDIILVKIDLVRDTDDYEITFKIS